MKSFITISLLLMMSAIASAEVIAKAAAICLGVEKKELIRTVYVTQDKSVLMADPIGYLVKVEKVDRINDSTLKISYNFPETQESLIIHNEGNGELLIKNSTGEQKYEMKCYSNQTAMEKSLLRE